MTPTVRDVLLHLGLGLVALAALAAAPTAMLDLPVRFPVVALAVYAAAVPLILLLLPARLPGDRFGPANRVTLVRLTATAVLAAAAALPAEVLADHRLLWLLAVLAVAAAVLDGVDGWVARRQGVASPFGARFDMELDAFVTLVLSVLLWRLDRSGAWLLAAGASRYLFQAAGLVWPWLAAELPPRQRRRVACAVFVGTLSGALAPVVPQTAAVAATGAATAFLLLSFALDVVWLYRRRDGGLRP